MSLSDGFFSGLSRCHFSSLAAISINFLPRSVRTEWILFVLCALSEQSRVRGHFLQLKYTTTFRALVPFLFYFLPMPLKHPKSATAFQALKPLVTSNNTSLRGACFWFDLFHWALVFEPDLGVFLQRTCPETNDIAHRQGFFFPSHSSLMELRSYST